MSDDELDIVVPRRASPPRGPIPRIAHSESNGSKVSKSDSQSSTVEVLAPPPPEEEMSLMQRMAMRMGGLNLESNAVAPAISSATSSKSTAVAKKPAKKLAPARSTKAKKAAPVSQIDSESEMSCDGEIMSPPIKADKSASTISKTSKANPSARGRRAATKAKPTYVESASEEEDDASSVDFDDFEDEESDYCPSD